MKSSTLSTETVILQCGEVWLGRTALSSKENEYVKIHCNLTLNFYCLVGGVMAKDEERIC